MVGLRSFGEIVTDSQSLLWVGEAAKLKDVTVTDASYQRVMKDLCYSRGSIWTLKPGGIKSEKE